MSSRIIFILTLCLAASLACGQSTSNDLPFQPGELSNPTRRAMAAEISTFDEAGIDFGFFPSPPEPTLDAILRHFEDLGDHADFILVQPNVPWDEFKDGAGGDSQAGQDIRNQVLLAHQNGLEVIFVVDPLNGLNRREFYGLPAAWPAEFANPSVRQAFRNFALWLVQEFNPKYLGLASEINTYMDAHPNDADHFLSLYNQIYDEIKESSAGTKVFVTFQWDDLNNMFPQASEGRTPGEINWEQVERFEPRLDIWAISSYPYFVFNGGEAIPEDYYSSLLARTEKPVAVAEGGFSSRPIGPIQVDQTDQVAYLEAIYSQLGARMSFWVYIVLNDLDMASISSEMSARGRTQRDIDTLSMFASVGLRQVDGAPKPALVAWDSYRQAQQK